MSKEATTENKPGECPSAKEFAVGIGVIVSIIATIIFTVAMFRSGQEAKLSSGMEFHKEFPSFVDGVYPHNNDIDITCEQVRLHYRCILEASEDIQSFDKEGYRTSSTKRNYQRLYECPVHNLWGCEKVTE